MRHYNPVIWEDLTMDEKKTYEIYEEFQRAYDRKVKEGKVPPRLWLSTASKKSAKEFERDGKYPGDDIREHKNWRIFQEIYDKYKSFSNFDPAIFVRGAFFYRDIKSRLYPSMLLTKEAEESYFQYLEKLIHDAQKGDGEDGIITALTGARQVIWKILRLDPEDAPNYEKIFKFFNYLPEGHLVPRGVSFAMSGMISPYYLANSRSFRKIYPQLDPDVKAEIGFETSQDMEVYVASVRQFSKAFRAAKLLFGEDIL